VRDKESVCKWVVRESACINVTERWREREREQVCKRERVCVKARYCECVIERECVCEREYVCVFMKVSACI
jgi:hypothetical protein